MDKRYLFLVLMGLIFLANAAFDFFQPHRQLHAALYAIGGLGFILIYVGFRRQKTKR